MKKKTFLSAILLLSMGMLRAQYFVASQNLSDSQDDVVAFAVMSDTHFENYNGIGAQAKVPRALKSLTSKGPLDALFVVGDLSNSGTAAQYKMFTDVFSDSTNFLNPVGRKVYMMGNHDNYSSNAASIYSSSLAVLNNGESYPLDQYMVINGFPFITISQRNGSNTDGYYASYGTSAYPEAVCQQLSEWMKRAVSECPGKPIFVFTHVPPTNTMYSSWSGEGAGTTAPNWSMHPVGDVLADYPQAVVFSGHSHFPIGDPRSIHQGVSPTSSRHNYYTAIGTGSTTYSEIEAGKVDAGIHPEGYGQVTEGFIVRVKKNGDVVFHRYDTYRDEEMHPEAPWTISAPYDGSMFCYADKRDSLELSAGQAYRTGLPAPVWSDGAALSVVPAIYSAQVTFPQATDNDCVFRYKVTLKNNAGRVLSTNWIFSGFFLGKDMPDSLSTTLSGLTPGKDYVVEVTAYDSYDNASEQVLKTEFSVAEDTDPSNLPPTPAARWAFDDESNLLSNSVEGSALSLQKAVESGTTVTLKDDNGIKAIAGPSDDNGGIYVPKAAAFRVNRETTDSVKNYTLQYDVRVEATDVYHALLQTNPNNSDDADFFINKSAKVGLAATGWGYGGTVNTDTWHRIVLVVKDGVPNAYIDGALVSKGTAAASRWILCDDHFYLFCDNNGEDADIDVAEVAYWNTALTDRQIANLGQVKTNDYMTSSTQEVNVLDDQLDFKVIVSSTVEPSFTFPEWVKAVQTSPVAGENIEYTFRCDTLDAAVGKRTDTIYVYAPEGSGLDKISIPITQINRGDVINGKKVGEWTFEDAGNYLKNSVENSKISLKTGLEGSNKITLCDLSESGITAAEGPSTDKKAVLIPKMTGLKIENGFAAELSDWSCMMDVKLTKAGWYALFNKNVANSTDADLFIRTDGKIGLNVTMLGYAGNVSTDSWHRIVWTVKGSYLTIYVDGTLVIASTTANTRWNLRSDGSLIFADNSAEDNDIYVSNVTLWSDYLTASQVSSLGKIK